MKAVVYLYRSRRVPWCEIYLSSRYFCCIDYDIDTILHYLLPLYSVSVIDCGEVGNWNEVWRALHL